MKTTNSTHGFFQKLGLTRFNLHLFIAGIIMIVLGYISLAAGKTYDFLSLFIGPVLLVLGYVVMIPLAIMYRRGKTN